MSLPGFRTVDLEFMCLQSIRGAVAELLEQLGYVAESRRKV